MRSLVCRAAIAVFLLRYLPLIRSEPFTPWSTYPECSQNCLNDIVPPSSSGCLLDNSCLCPNAEWLSSAAQCLGARCGRVELIVVAMLLDADCTNLNIPMAITRADFISSGVEALPTSLPSASSSTTSPTSPPTPTQSKAPNDRMMIAGIAAGAGVAFTCIVLALFWVVFGLRKTQSAQPIDLDMESASCIAELKSKSASFDSGHDFSPRTPTFPRPIHLRKPRIRHIPRDSFCYHFPPAPATSPAAPGENPRYQTHRDARVRRNLLNSASIEGYPPPSYPNPRPMRDPHRIPFTPTHPNHPRRAARPPPPNFHGTHRTSQPHDAAGLGPSLRIVRRDALDGQVYDYPRSLDV